MSSVEDSWFQLLKKQTESKDFGKRYSKTNKSTKNSNPFLKYLP